MMIENCKAYELISRESLPDVHSEGWLLRHKKSGARIMLLENDDDNKVFNIAFRTPPANSTGVAHIMEHSVLEGSQKFPLKDPFVELVKGSLNTFLNAMTYPDKTMYPVASCNDVDFQNLMDVYLDAVFHPICYDRKEIFLQEGWHYHMEDAESPITYNGVVYNEMKGAFSTADDVLNRQIFSSLFPDTPYGVESGGDPDCIPDLTYEEFLNFHRTYYHPSNSFLYLYGNMDMEEKLRWLDENYLSAYENAPVSSRIPEQKPFEKTAEFTYSYPIMDEEETEGNAYLSWNAVIGDGANVETNLAFTILDYVLLGTPGAPVKQALLDAGVGKDVYGGFYDGILQPFFSVVAKYTDAEEKDHFLSVIRDTLSRIAEEGIDQKAVEAAINYFEFRFREADYSSFPKGLIYGINVFDSWLYDEQAPFAYLKQLDAYAAMREKAKTGFFEELIRTKLLNNSHSSIVTLVPERGYAARKEQEIAGKLAAYKEGLSEEERKQLIEDTLHLIRFQEEEDSEEVKKLIPLLAREDIRKEAEPYDNAVYVENGTTLLHHDVFTNGIGYMDLLFRIQDLPDEDVPYLGLLKSILGLVSTDHYSYKELYNEINAQSGGISYGINMYSDWDEPKNNDKYALYLAVHSKFLYPKLSFVMDMIREMILYSRFDDFRRLRELIAQTRSRMSESLVARGNTTAMMRAASYHSPVYKLQDRMSGIDYYRFIKRLDAHFEEEKELLAEKLEKLVHFVFRPENLFVSYTSDQEAFAGLKPQVEELKSVLYTDPVEKGQICFVPCQKNEAFATSSQVQFVCRSGNFRREGLEFHGALRILRVMLGYDYLWNNIRVKGGAYGCGGNFGMNGLTSFTSYRDPHLERTLKIYEGIPEYVRNIVLDEREMTKYIIGTISEMDTPLTPQSRGSRSLSAYLNHSTYEEIQKYRDQILNATPEDITALSEIVEASLKLGAICVVGSESKIEKHKELFGSVETL